MAIAGPLAGPLVSPCRFDAAVVVTHRHGAGCRRRGDARLRKLDDAILPREERPATAALHRDVRDAAAFVQEMRLQLTRPRRRTYGLAAEVTSCCAKADTPLRLLALSQQ